MPARLTKPLGLAAGVAAVTAGLAVTRAPDIAARVPGQLVAVSEPKGETARPRPFAESALTGKLDLAAITLVGDHYEAPLADGRRAILTLDPTLQRAAERVLEQARAPMAAVVVTATDGRILALAGGRMPSPTAAILPDWQLAVDDWAPAASIFKIVTAAALVESGTSPDQEVCYHGGVRSVLPSNLENHRADRRCNDLGYGLAHSQNAIFAKLAYQRLEPAVLEQTAGRLGIDGPLPAFALAGTGGACDLPPARGLDFAKAAAGFSGTRLSPLGGALLANTIATRGLAVSPTIIREIVSGSERHPTAPGAKHRVLAADVARKVADMMVETCESGSAARTFRGKKGRVAGKTGTLNRTDGPFMQYSWFVGFAPADTPEVSIAVLLGNAELWHLKAHTAASIVLAAR